MVRTDWKDSISNITENELSLVSEKAEIEKLNKELNKNKRAIDEYKEREKSSARALILYERKIHYLKQKSIDEILNLCHKLESSIETENFKNSNFTYDSVIDKLYDICNLIEQNAGITNEDRAFISNKPMPEKSVSTDVNSRFARLKQEFNQKVGESVNRKPGRPKKADQSIVSDIGLGKKIKDKEEIDIETKAKLNEIFYETPKNTSVMSNIPLTEDSLFDFSEALNPNISLKDIMADLMEEKQDEPVKTYSKVNISELSKNNVKEEQSHRSKADMLESGIISTIKFKPISNNKENIQKEIKTEEDKFFSLGRFFTEDDE